MIIIDGRPKHAPAILEIRARVRADTYPNPAHGTTREFYLGWNAVTAAMIEAEATHLQDDQQQYWLAEDNGTIAGYARVIKDDPQSIDMIHILPEYQGNGLGNELLALAYSALDQARAMHLEFIDGNTKARDWYLRLGWRLTGESRNGSVPLQNGSGFVPLHAMVLEPKGKER